MKDISRFEVPEASSKAHIPNSQKLRNRLKASFFLCLLTAVFFAACSDDDFDTRSRIGAILFTSSHDCLIVLLDSVQNPVTSQFYETAKQPVVVYPKSEGVYFVHAFNYIPNDKPFVASIKFIKGYNLEYYIEFP